MRIYTCSGKLPLFTVNEHFVLINSDRKLKFPHIHINSELSIEVLQNKIELFLSTRQEYGADLELTMTEDNVKVVDLDLSKYVKEEIEVNMMKEKVNEIIQEEKFIELHLEKIKLLNKNTEI